MRRFSYIQEVTGVEIELHVPWVRGSDLIPPTVIEFRDLKIRTQMPFTFQGEKHD